MSNNAGAYYNGTVYSFGSRVYPPSLAGIPTPPDFPIAKYSVADDRWSTLETNVGRHGSQFSIAMIGSKGYFTGGSVNNTTLNFVDNVSEFDFETETFTDKSPLPFPLRLHSSAAVDGKVYVMGGRWQVEGFANFHTELWVYDPTEDEWEVQPGFTFIGRNLGQAFATNGRVYYTGGLNSGEVYNDTYQYSPVTETWARRADFPIARHSHAAVVVGEKAYLVRGSPRAGGVSPANTVVEFTPSFFGDDPVAVRVKQQVSGSALRQGGSLTSTVRFLIEASNPEAGETVQIDVEVKLASDPDWSDATVFSSGQVLPTTWTFDYAPPATGGHGIVGVLMAILALGGLAAFRRK